ncbi:MAG: hypothetical protein CMG42_00870 [Candidatus Marinimicrobia bacterium]|jgi:hypothetical protein|nr:hypothetical protein [Candidatus Neomarinimicrobiota bacterium]|tara:strand:- start:14 stop:601 length:588 start_codon:yes stop_codon:yes gene_type:complete
MNVRLSLYGLIFFSFLKGSTLSDLDSLKIGLQFFRWKKIDVELNQFQYGQIYNSNLSVFFIDSTDYLIESKEQDIFVSGNNIKTFNKNTKQLIIDERLPEDRDFFSILTGDISGVSISNKRNEKGLITFSFEMKDFGMKGTISVTSGNWHFENLYVVYDKDNWINLQLDSWQILRGSYIFSEFGKDAMEVIDLRE